MYKFYIYTDAGLQGPYSAVEIRDMQLEKGTLLSEMLINDGEPIPIEDLDIDFFCGEELGIKIEPKMQKRESEALDKEEVETTVEEEAETTDEDKPAITENWNWGAFSLPAIWGLFNGIYWPLAVNLIISALLQFAMYVISDSSIIITVASLVLTFLMMVYLGTEGNKLAWKKAAKYKSKEKFESSQRIWNKIGIISFVIIVIL